jgi:hypothetical protein
MKTILMSGILSTILAACGSLKNKLSEKDAPLSMVKTANQTGRLHLEGYYYHQYTADDKTYTGVSFLYQNGVYMDCGTYVDKTREEIIAYIRSDRFKSQLAGNKNQWGLYTINENRILINKWAIDQGHYIAVLMEGEIPDMEAFSITQMKSGKGNTSRVNLQYRFSALSPKPDSTSNFLP